MNNKYSDLKKVFNFLYDGEAIFCPFLHSEQQDGAQPSVSSPPGRLFAALPPLSSCRLPAPITAAVKRKKKHLH